jgi:hypothetical protein
MSDVTSAIPTTYRSERFRSRIEARWAAFFDLLKWPWEYEPLDLRGYIPDFILTFEHGPLLVEVKSELDIQALSPHAPKIWRSGWQGEFLLVGARLWREDGDGYSCGYPIPGMMGWCGPDGTWPSPRGGGWLEPWEQEPAVLFDCGDCDRPSVRQMCAGCYRCRRCGSRDGYNKHPKAKTPFAEFWAEAGNKVRWTPR